MRLLHRLARNRRAAAAMQYGLIAALVAVAAIGAAETSQDVRGHEGKPPAVAAR